MLQTNNIKFNILALMSSFILSHFKVQNIIRTFELSGFKLMLALQICYNYENSPKSIYNGKFIKIIYFC